MYQRIFSDNEDSLCNYLPKEGGYYDVSVTYRKYKDIAIAQIEYPSFNQISKNSIEFVAIYLEGKWNLITINFLNLQSLFEYLKRNINEKNYFSFNYFYILFFMF